MRQSRGATLRAAVLGGCFGLLGAGVGCLAAKVAISAFKGAAEWKLPALVAGSITLALIAIFTWVAISERRGTANINDQKISSSDP
jgi:zinc transporter ZupT